MAHNSSRAASLVGPSSSFAAVTPSDVADLPGGRTRAIFIGAAGDVALLDATGAVAVFASAAHQYHPIGTTRVLATGTTAGGIVALY